MAVLRQQFTATVIGELAYKFSYDRRISTSAKESSFLVGSVSLPVDYDELPKGLVSLDAYYCSERLSWMRRS